MKSLLLVACTLIALNGCATTAPDKRYVCACGTDCRNCSTTSAQPGTCACGKPLVAR